MVNEIYSELLRNLYEHVPTFARDVISNFSPERLYEYVKIIKPSYLDKIWHGIAYAPYDMGASIIVSSLLRNKANPKVLEHVRGLPWPLVVLAYPIAEEVLLRFIPAYLGRYFGGERGELISLGASSLIFAAMHADYYKDGHKIRGVISRIPGSLIYSHVYLYSGLFGSIGLHSAVNTVVNALISFYKKRD